MRIGWLGIVAAALTATAGGEFENPLAEYLQKGLLSAKDSSETPSLFEARDRQIRWNNVLRTNQPCPSYESWRTRPGASPKDKHVLKMVFTKPVSIGTLLSFGGDAPDNSFRVFANVPGVSQGESAVSTAFSAPVSEITFTADRLSPSVMENWGSRGGELSGPLASYNLSLLGIYALPEARRNLALAVSPQVSGLLLAKEADAPRNSAEGLVDGSSFTFWRSEKLSPGQTAHVELTFPKAVVLREIGLYIGNQTYGEMPGKVEVAAAGEDGVFKPFGVFDSFTNHPHTGRHFYLLKNAKPEEKILKLQLVLTPMEKKQHVALTEILLLAAPDENGKIVPRAEAAFAKNIDIQRKDATFAGARIEDAEGRVVKTLSPVESAAGAFRFAWDGTDDAGKVAPAGKYALHGASRAALKAEYESTPYSPNPTPWVTPSRRGGWLSDHVEPSTVEFIGNQLWVGSQIAESGDTIMTLDPSGKKLWGVRWLNLAGAAIIRECGESVFIASGGGWVGTKIVVTELDPKTKTFKTPLKYDFPKGMSTAKSHFRRSLTGMAADKTHIAVALEELNRIELFDRSGKKVRDLTLDKPGALRFTPEGKLLAISGKQLLLVDVENGSSKVVIGQGIVDPRDFTVLPEGYLVADFGANQVKLFDKNGKLVRAFGSGAPRKAGKFDMNVMNAPNAAALDAEGRLWVAESGVAPKRISRWNFKTGKCIDDFLGPARYEASAWLDPADKNTAYAEGMTFRFDPAAKKWNLASVYEDSGNPTYNLLKADKMIPERPFRLNGKLFLARDRHWTAPAQFFGEMGKDGILQPRAALGTYTILEKAFAERPANYSGNAKVYTFLWNDLNGNGKMEWNELSFDKAAYSVLEWNCRFGDKLEIYYYRNNLEVARLAPTWKNNLPIYDWKDLKIIHTFPRPVRIVAISPLGTDRVLLNTLPELLCLNTETGKLLWSYPNPHPSNRHDSPLPKPGEIQHTLNVEGTVSIPQFGNIFMLNSNKGLRHLFSFDGIYLGKIFEDQRLAAPLAIEDLKPGMDLAPLSLMDEAFCGTFERASDGLIRFSGGKNHHSISVIRNLETLRDFKQSFTFTPDDATAAAEALAARIAQERNARLRPDLTISDIAAAIPLRGNPADWKNIPAATLTDSRDKMLFSVQLARTATDFYGAFRVMDSSPFVNKGEDEKMLFKTGDSVNLELGAHRGASPVAGDVRVLIAPFKGKPTAVVYRYRVDGTAKNPVEFMSPGNKVVIDAVDVLANAAIKVTPQSGGYFVEFKIPRKELPVLEKAELSGDAGVIFSDDAGNINRYNAFYHSALKGVTADVPSEIRLLPNQWKSIRIVK